MKYFTVSKTIAFLFNIETELINNNSYVVIIPTIVEILNLRLLNNNILRYYSLNSNRKKYQIKINKVTIIKYHVLIR